MKQLSVAFLSTVFLFTFDSQAAKVIHCDNCTQSQIESKVKSQPIGNIYYVIDFQLQRVTGFEWMIYESGGWEETSFYPKLTSSRVPDNITSKMAEFFSYRQQFWNALSNNPNAIGQLLNEISGSNYTGSTKPELVDSHFAFNSVTSSDCGKGEATPYDFMTTSSMRKQVFNRMLTSYPDVQSAFNSWNTFAQFSSVSVGPASVSSAWLTLPQTINFQDSGHLKVTISPSGDTFNVVAGSAFDCSGNQIPDNQSGFIGNFVFESLAAQNDFRVYSSLFNIEFAMSSICLPDFRTTCVQTASGKYTCTLVAKSC